jgi:hypothetical protein
MQKGRRQLSEGRKGSLGDGAKGKRRKLGSREVGKLKTKKCSRLKVES